LTLERAPQCTEWYVIDTSYNAFNVITNYNTEICSNYVDFGSASLTSQIKRWVPGFHGTDSRKYRMPFCANRTFENTYYSYKFGDEKIINIPQDSMTSYNGTPNYET
jgi:hypothetical protein